MAAVILRARCAVRGAPSQPVWASPLAVALESRSAGGIFGHRGGGDSGEAASSRALSLPPPPGLGLGAGPGPSVPASCWLPFSAARRGHQPWTTCSQRAVCAMASARAGRREAGVESHCTVSCQGWGTLYREVRGLRELLMFISTALHFPIGEMG